MSDDPDQLARLKALRSLIFEVRDESVYVILDGASVPHVLGLLHNRPEEVACLYRGELEPDLAAMAPYLVKLRKDSPLTTTILKEGWGQHWGVFVITPVGLEALRRHLRGFLRVRGPEGNVLYFRYYDPRVLPVFLPTCYAREIQTIFGPISRFIAEDEDSLDALVLDKDLIKISPRRIDLCPSETSAPFA